MKRFISFFACVAAMLGVVSCDDEITYVGGEDLYFLKSMTNTDYDIHKKYIYDLEMNLMQIVESEVLGSSVSETFDISYNSDYVTLSYESGESTVLMFKDGYVSTLSKYDADRASEYSIRYYYNTSGYLSKFVKSEGSTTTTTTCTWSSGNLTMIETTIASPTATTYNKLEIEYSSSKAKTTNFDMNFYTIAEEFQQFPTKWFGNYPTNLSTKRIYYASKTDENEAWEAITNGDVENSYTFDENGCVSSYSSSSAAGDWSMSFTYTVVD
ncbi:MAG: hypothetical protein SNH35_00790 [Rikenellaceae bacterium]